MSTNSPPSEPRHPFPGVIDPEWDAMLARGEEPEIPDWHWEVLEEVEKSIKDGTAVFRPWEEVKAELQREFPNT